MHKIEKNYSHHAITRFQRDEDGSFVLFGIYLFIVMLLVGGLGVDIIRHDYERLRMQGTVDSAILAAADLDQKLDPESVVRDHFKKAGVLERLKSVEVTENINSRVVSAQASMDVHTMFIRSIGIDNIGAHSGGIAREDIRDIEVSMVLDISGSMGRDNRIENLKLSAKDFVSTVLAGADEERGGEVSISLIPYSTEVAAGPEMLALMNLRNTHPYSSCVDFTSADFDEISLDFSRNRSQTGHFDPWHSAPWNDSVFEREPQPLRLPCRNEDYSQITYFSQDMTDLHERIDALVPGGNTSIDVGLKWGAALLDPSTRTAITELADQGKADPAFIGRPYDHGRNNTMKILVVMTDGQNTTQYKLHDAYAGGTLSDVWLDNEFDVDGLLDPSERFKMSIQDQEYQDQDGDDDWWEDYYRPTWAVPDDGYSDDSTRRWTDNPWGGESARRLSYAELWSMTTLGWHAYWGRYRQTNDASDYYDWAEDPYYTIGPSTKDPRMEEMCRLAKDEDILIFSIALDISESNATRMKECASSDNHYFNVTGSEIRYAFAAIASTINQLRLVQ